VKLADALAFLHCTTSEAGRYTGFLSVSPVKLVSTLALTLQNVSPVKLAGALAFLQQ
jgi:hypothetical protein